MVKKPYELIDTVNSHGSFVKFTTALLEHLKEHPSDWENPTLDSFLEAMAAWTTDAEGTYILNDTYEGEPINWRFAAQLLLSASSYE